MENPYQALKAELDKTGVISKEFKGLILSYMLSGMEYARDYGRDEGYKMLGVEQDPDSKKWYILDDRGERLHGPYSERPQFAQAYEMLTGLTN